MEYKLSGILNDVKGNHIIIGLDNKTEDKLNALKKRMFPKKPIANIHGSYKNPIYLCTAKVNYRKTHLFNDEVFDKMKGKKIIVRCKVRKYSFDLRRSDKDSPKITGWLLNMTNIAPQ